MKTSELIKELKTKLAANGQFGFIALPPRAESIIAALERGEKMREALESLTTWNGREPAGRRGEPVIDCSTIRRIAKEALAGGAE